MPQPKQQLRKYHSTNINTPTPSHTPLLIITIISNTPLFNTNQYHSIIEVGVLSNRTIKTTHYYNINNNKLILHHLI